MEDIEKLKKGIEDFEIQELAQVIRRNPLISGNTTVIIYNKKQREELKNCMVEIAKRSLDLANLEDKFLNENITKKENHIFINNEEDIKDLIKNIKSFNTLI